VGIDSSAEMLHGAEQILPRDRVSLLQQDLSAALPDETFDLVISALAIHHLEGNTKAKLFLDVARRLDGAGRFVLGDVIIPEDPADAVIENEPGYDFPSKLEEQQSWMRKAGLTSEVLWVRQDLAVLKAELTVP
jgi:tRNA (cmo5U34)-methyltransferase